MVDQWVRACREWSKWLVGNGPLPESRARVMLAGTLGVLVVVLLGAFVAFGGSGSGSTGRGAASALTAEAPPATTAALPSTTTTTTPSHTSQNPSAAATPAAPTVAPTAAAATTAGRGAAATTPITPARFRQIVRNKKREVHQLLKNHRRSH